MKKFFLAFEALWVSITFAEAGIYEPEVEGLHQTVLEDAARIV